MRHPWNEATPKEKQIIAGNLRAMAQTEGWKWLETFIRFRIEQLKEQVFEADVDSEIGRRMIGMCRQERLLWEVLLKRPEEWVRGADALVNEGQSDGEDND